MPSTYRPIFIRYIGVYIACLVVVSMVGVLLKTIMPNTSFGNVLWFVVSIMASMDAGQRYFRTYNARPERAIAWKFAAMFTGFSFALSLLVTVIVAQFSPPMRHALSEIAAVMGGASYALWAIFVGVLLLLAALHMIVSRSMFAMGAKNAQKAADKAEQKNAQK